MKSPVVTDSKKRGEWAEALFITEALKRGLDFLICGNCIHRGDGKGKKRTCYVNLGQGPRAVWEAWKRGRYERLNDKYINMFIAFLILGNILLLILVIYFNLNRLYNLENTLKKYYNNVKFNKNLFKNPQKTTSLNFGFICPGAIKTIEYLIETTEKKIF